ncbi:cytochrome P450 71D7-like [Solanum stenotomum]|uniref:cytochrome P450 71D7-like n=1 Tax=Solanum stenotomum TaxID=172797 RepID=UPI0020D14FD1|nr:cytochrome P450 71D7-like [Solanum stenotomum]
MYSSLFTIVSLLLFFSFFFILLSRNRKQTRLPPGPWRLPFIGSLHHLIGRGHLHPNLRNLAQRYGPLMYLQLGEIPVVIISSSTIAKELLTTHDLAFADRPQSTSTTIIFYNNKDIVFSPYDNYCKQMRKICKVQLFSAKMVKSFSTIRKDEISSLISSIRSTRDSPINMTEKIFWFTNSVTCSAAFGKMFKDRDEFVKLLKDILILASGFCVTDLFPSWKLLHKLSGAESRLMNAHKKVDEIMEDILKEHLENKANRNKGIGDQFGGEDLVDVLLKVMEDAELECPITNDHIKAVILDIFIAGSETSSTITIWVLSEMMKNPTIMAKAQKEVRQVFRGKKDYDNEEDLEKLTYLKLVIKETLRLHTPAPLLGPRECREQTNIDGYTIPLKTKILVNAWALARDPRSWHDPESFIPERFENSSIDFMGNHFEFIPFGAGRRMCPGVLFGLTNVELSLAQLLYHFEWELPYGMNPKDLDMTETYGLSGGKQRDLYLVAR